MNIRHFDIKDRAGCQKAKRAISVGCLPQGNKLAIYNMCEK